MNNLRKEDIVSHIITSYIIPQNPLYRIKYFYVESHLNWGTEGYFEDEPASLLKLKHKNIIVEAVKGNVYTHDEYNKLKKENPNFKLNDDDVTEKNNFLYVSCELKKSIVKESFIEKWKSLPNRTIRAGESAFVLTDVERLV